MTKTQIFLWSGLILLFTLIVIVLGMPTDCTSPTTNVKSSSGWFKSCPNCPATTTVYLNQASKLTADDAPAIQMNLGGGTLTASKVNGTTITGTSNLCIGGTCIEEKHLKVLNGAAPFGIINSGEKNWLGRVHGDRGGWFHEQYDGYGELYFRNMGVVA